MRGTSVTKPLILASASKTRATMLKNAGVNFEIVPATVDEATVKASLIEAQVPPRDLADQLADLKARSVSMIMPEAYVIGADQILECENKIYSKSDTIESAQKTLAELSGKTHRLYSAAAIYRQGAPIWRLVDVASLRMRQLSSDFIDYYLDRVGDAAFWSVGAYQIEGIGLQLFEAIDGNHFTILGLPMIPLLDFMRLHRFLET